MNHRKRSRESCSIVFFFFKTSFEKRVAMSTSDESWIRMTREEKEIFGTKELKITASLVLTCDWSVSDNKTWERLSERDKARYEAMASIARNTFKEGDCPIRRIKWVLGNHYVL